MIPGLMHTWKLCAPRWFMRSCAHSPVKAFMKVESERVSILKNGSRTGKRCEPQSVVCSRMWATPVLSIGVVRKPTLRETKRGRRDGGVRERADKWGWRVGEV